MSSASAQETTSTAPDWALGMTSPELDEFSTWWLKSWHEVELVDEPSSRDRAVRPGRLRRPGLLLS